MRTKVPDRISAPIRRLANRISDGTKPLYIPSRPDAKAIELDCFENVRKKIESDGGSSIYGWNVWFCAGILIEAEFHSVWKSPAGEMLNVTPLPIETDRILFIPDPKRKYEGVQVDNIRIALQKNPLIKEYIQLHQRMFKIMNRGDLAHQHGFVIVDPHEYVPIKKRLDKIQLELNKLN